MSTPEAAASQSFEELVDGFATAERALRDLAERARQLSTAEEVLRTAAAEVDVSRQQLEISTAARVSEAASVATSALEAQEQANDAIRSYAAERLDLAQTELANARSDLSRAEQSLRDTASAVYSLTDEVKGTSRELKDTSAALRGLDPAALLNDLRRARIERLVLMVLASIILCVSIAGIFF